MSRILLLDTGIGNIQSVANILEHIGADYFLADEPAALEKADKIIFPGVGTYGNAMENIRLRGLDVALKNELLQKRKPGLGICVGMQVLSTLGKEFGEHEGLGIVPGVVDKIPVAGKGLRLPHVGWNDVAFNKDCPLFFGVPAGASFYFLHSYYLTPDDPAHIVATVDYGEDLVAAVQRDNIFGVQFHPEKSQEAGILLMKNFLNL